MMASLVDRMSAAWRAAEPAHIVPHTLQPSLWTAYVIASVHISPWPFIHSFTIAITRDWYFHMLVCLSMYPL
jgi:hypothetical protein